MITTSFYTMGAFSPGAFIAAFYSAISIHIFMRFVYAKLISEGLKKNADLQGLRFNNLYKEIRELLMENVIKC